MTTGFGARLRDERMRLGLTQAEFAEQVGVKKQSIYLYEKETNSPTWEFIYSLKSVGVSLQYLCLGKTEVPKPSDFPPEVWSFAIEMVNDIERKFTDGRLSNDIKMKMTLLILEKYSNSAAKPSITDSQVLDLLGTQ